MEDIAQMVDKLQLKIEEQREIIEPLLNRVRLVKTLLLQFFFNCVCTGERVARDCSLKIRKF